MNTSPNPSCHTGQPSPAFAAHGNTPAQPAAPVQSRCDSLHEAMWSAGAAFNIVSAMIAFIDWGEQSHTHGVILATTVFLVAVSASNYIIRRIFATVAQEPTK